MECFKWGLVGQPSRNMEDFAAEGDLNIVIKITSFQPLNSQVILDLIKYLRLTITDLNYIMTDICVGKGRCEYTHNQVTA